MASPSFSPGARPNIPPSIRALLGWDTAQFTRLVVRPTSLCHQLSGNTGASITTASSTVDTTPSNQVVRQYLAYPSQRRSKNLDHIAPPETSRRRDGV